MWHNLLHDYGYAGLFALLAAGVVGVPVPDETLLAVAGLLIRRGDFHPAAAWSAAVAGSLCGLSISFILGRTLGYGVIHRFGPWLHISEAQLARFHVWYDRWGRWLITFGYFVPGVRHLVAIVAGASKLSWRVFLPFAATGAVLWVSTFVSLGYSFGRQWQNAGLPVRLGMIGFGTVVSLAGLTAALIRRRRARRRLRSV